MSNVVAHYAKSPMPDDESARLEALQSYAILDSEPEPAFDGLTLLAAQICEAPIALIGLVDAERLWFKSRLGLAAREGPREGSFCTYTIAKPESLLVVPDACADPRFAESPQVTSFPRIRFYAGSALQTPEGHAVGTLCIMDRAPRRLNPEQSGTLQMLAAQVAAQMELRKSRLAAHQFAAERQEQVDKLREKEERCDALAAHILELREALERTQSLRGLLPICSSCKKVRDAEERWHEIENYIGNKTDLRFTHTICERCSQRLYPDVEG